MNSETNFSSRTRRSFGEEKTELKKSASYIIVFRPQKDNVIRKP